MSVSYTSINIIFIYLFQVLPLISLTFKSLGLKVSFVHQGCIYLIKIQLKQ